MCKERKNVQSVIFVHFSSHAFPFLVHLWLSFTLTTEDRNLLLLEIPPVLFIDQHQVQIILCRELHINIPKRRGQLKPAQEQPNRDRFAPHRRAIHDLKLGDRLALVVLVGWGARGLAPDNGQLHMLDLDTHEQEIDFAHDHVLEVVPRLVVLKLDMQTVLDADLHLDRVVAVRGHHVRVHPDVLLFDHVSQSTQYCHAHKVSTRRKRYARLVFHGPCFCLIHVAFTLISFGKLSNPVNLSRSFSLSLPQLDVDAMVALILLLNVLELKVEIGRVSEFAWHSQLLLDRPELVMVSTVVEQF